jgi:hypothetical protein
VPVLRRVLRALGDPAPERVLPTEHADLGIVGGVPREDGRDGRDELGYGKGNWSVTLLVHGGGGRLRHGGLLSARGLEAAQGGHVGLGIRGPDNPRGDLAEAHIGDGAHRGRNAGLPVVLRVVEGERGAGQIATLHALHERALGLRHVHLELEPLGVGLDAQRLRGAPAQDMEGIMVPEGHHVRARRERAGHRLREDAFPKAAEIFGEDVRADRVANEPGPLGVGHIGPQLECPDVDIISYADCALRYDKFQLYVNENRRAALVHAAGHHERAGQRRDQGGHAVDALR